MIKGFICALALLTGFISGCFVAVPFFTPSITVTIPNTAVICNDGSSNIPCATPIHTEPEIPPKAMPDTSTPQTIGGFDKSLVIALQQTVTYKDGLLVTVTAINDSRCKSGVQCIWAGELAPVLYVTGGDYGTTSEIINLGSARTQTVELGNYVFTLGETTLDTITLTVTKKPVTTKSQTSLHAPTAQTVSVARLSLTKTPAVQSIDFATEVVRLIEQETSRLRKQESLTAFSSDATLVQSATRYSKRLQSNDFLSHIDINGCSLTCRFKESGYQAQSWGENLALMKYEEQPTAAYVADFFMSQWIKSAGHRENLLSATFTKQGIGISVDATSVYVVVHFALPAKI